MGGTKTHIAVADDKLVVLRQVSHDGAAWPTPVLVKHHLEDKGR